jgi:hypothetical protein
MASIAVAANTVATNTAARALRRRHYSSLAGCFSIQDNPVPKAPLVSTISIAAANWSRVADGFDKVADTASLIELDRRYLF